jgi:hypothetical protein
MEPRWRRQYTYCMILYQRPNVPIICAAVGFVAAIVWRGVWGGLAYYVAVVSLGVWAALEIVGGINWFRRLLGWLGLLGAIIAVAIQM